jgi:signal transduction histidine kinase
MKEVLDNLLDLSLIVSGQNVAKPTWFEPSPLLKLLESAHRPVAHVKGLEFTATIEGELGPVYSDELRVRQIVENLVSNAIKYTPEGEVHLRFEAVNAHVWAIVVQDTGLGIAEEHRQHIFSEYYQVASASPLRGSGLGLSIVSELVELLKGSISLESEPSRGSVFRVLLPRIHGTVEEVRVEQLHGEFE